MFVICSNLSHVDPRWLSSANVSEQEMDAGSTTGDSTDAIVMDDSSTEERDTQEAYHRWSHCVIITIKETTLL